MKERGILFNAEMVRAILDGRKTQTRRAVKFPFRDKDVGCELAGSELAGELKAGRFRNSPLGQPGDKLWGREAFKFAKSLDTYSPNVVAKLALEAGYPNPWAPIQFEAGGVRAGQWSGFNTPPVVTEPGKLRPSLHMPRWASRIDLLITGVKVERLQDISEEDAKAEGCVSSINLPGGRFANENFAWLWQSIYGDESWNANPWVWVIEFERAGGAA